MLRRKAETKIENWIENSMTALLVSGARQVGKTWSIRHCLQKNECNYLEINLIEEPELIDVLDACKNVNDLVINLSAAKNYSFVPGKTIVFIDEVQELKDIVTRIKFWVDEGSFRYILSGSLLGIELKNLRSAPVGYLTEIKMFPLSFEEFLEASSVPTESIYYLRDCYTNRKPVAELVHEKMIQHFQRYSGNITTVTEIQRNIIEQYKRDFTKYEEQQRRLMLVSIYDQVPAQLLKQNRRYMLSDIKKGLRFERVEDSFKWLSSAGVVIPVFNATEPRVALAQNAKSSLLKLYSSDVGLLTCQYGNAVRARILINDQSINLGGVYENAIAQELNTNGFQAYFYYSHSIGELDFLIEFGMSVIPIEVKSGKDYKIHSALSKVVVNSEYQINTAYVFANCNVSTEGKLVYLPAYMSTFIRDDTELPTLGPI